MTAQKGTSKAYIAQAVRRCAYAERSGTDMLSQIEDGPIKDLIAAQIAHMKKQDELIEQL